MRLNQQQILNDLGPRYAAALKSVATTDGDERACPATRRFQTVLSQGGLSGGAQRYQA